MLGRIKYKLLVWLLDDICKKTMHCEKCYMGCECTIADLKNSTECCEYDIFNQARRVWGLEE